MPNTITLKSGNKVFTGTLILTNYGRTRVLQRISEGENFDTFKFSSIGIGDKLTNNYTSDITELNNKVLSYEISDENVRLSGSTAIIETDLDITGEVAIQEIGLYEKISNESKLFAYASGFSVIKSEKITYDLIIDLALNLTFEQEHYNRYDVIYDESEYALAPQLTNMFGSLTRFQLDFERCIETNSNELGLNKAQSFMTEFQKMTDNLNNVFLLSRYQKVIKTLGNENITDCFYYPSEKKVNYSIKNLKDFTSQIDVTGDLQLSNRDNINLSGAATIILNAKLSSFTKEGPIIGKINPNEDEYYFDIRVIHDPSRTSEEWTDEEIAEKTDDEIKYNQSIQGWGIQFTIYSYDKDRVEDVRRGIYDEHKLVGHYRVKYFPPAQKITDLLANDKMFTFVYNGNIDNPVIKMYLGTEEVSNTNYFIVDNFNYMGPCKYFKNTCTLRNYSQTVSTDSFSSPMYYVLPDVEISSIIVFNKELTKEEIAYLAFVS